MHLLELALSNGQSEKHEYGSKIPWDDPDFSRRMLENHLSQDHDWASRRKTVIARHAAWIAGQLRQRPARILDLGCGPGLYTHALAEQGHHCVGVDFSPASIAYARKQADENGLRIEYILADIRNCKNEQAFDCILMTFGEVNVFTRQDAVALLRNCAGMLAETGLFILEAHTYEAVRAIGEAASLWQRQAGGLFSDKPHLYLQETHLYLQENIWNAPDATALSRYFIVDAASADARRYSSFMQAYTITEYRGMLESAGLPSPRILDADTWPTGDDFQGKLQVFVCRKSDL